MLPYNVLCTGKYGLVSSCEEGPFRLDKVFFLLFHQWTAPKFLQIEKASQCQAVEASVLSFCLLVISSYLLLPSHYTTTILSNSCVLRADLCDTKLHCPYNRDD